MQYPSSNDAQQQFIKLFLKRAEENPDLTLSQFMAEVEADDALATVLDSPPIPDTPPASVDYVEEDLDSILEELSENADSSQESDAVARLGDLVSTPQPNKTSPKPDAKPSFSFSAWYADNSIDFILYLGAFMIVAAVSLFVGFNWDNLSSIARFGIVVGFTVAWYVAGVAVQRFMNLDNVGIAFITIGAVLTPFCGVAWQRFVIDSLDGVGITWLLTALISTITYLTISLIYQRRYFTYFGNLSILATILSFVQITASPTPYYVLAGTATALILLLTRIALEKTAPRLDAYLGDDIEYSSWSIMAFSAIAGVILIPIFGVAFSGIEVFAVMFSILIYMGIILTRHLNRFTVVTTQLLAVFTVVQGLVMIDAPNLIVIYITFALTLGLQFVIDTYLPVDDEDNSLSTFASIVNVIISLNVYLVALDTTQASVSVLPIGLLVVAYGVLCARQADSVIVWSYVALISHFVLTHGMSLLTENEAIWRIGYLVLGIAQASAIFTDWQHKLVRAFVYVGVIIIGLTALYSIDDVYFASTSASLIINGLAPLLVLAVYGCVMLADSQRAMPVLKRWGYITLASLSVLFYVLVIDADITWLTMSFALAVMPMFALAQYITKQDGLYAPVFIAPYAVLFHFADMLAISSEQSHLYIVANGVLSLAIYFAYVLPDDTRFMRQVVAICGATLFSIVSFWLGIGDSDPSLHLAGWVCGYSVLVMLWLSREMIGDSYGDGLFTVAVLAQYYWHIIYLAETVDAQLFGDVQWYSASLATVIIVTGLGMLRRAEDSENNNAFSVFVIGTLILMFPTFGQIIDDGSLIYFALGVVYSLAIAGLGITLSLSRVRTLGAVSLVLVVLFQSSEFLFDLPRWLIVGIVGFGLIGAGLYLSLRRRTVKKPPIED